MASWVDASAGRVVAVIERDGYPESLHHGIVSVTDASGAELLAIGRTDTIVYPRSTLKPLQTIAVLGTGVELTDLEVALATASHSGSARHREAVESFLHRHQLGVSLLQCPADWPLVASEKLQMRLDGESSPTQLAMNCSGKHAGFLAACQHRGDDLENYLDPGHPLQRDIRTVIEDYTGETITHTSADGCGAPLHALSLRGLARGMSALTSSDDEIPQRIVRAVGEHSWALAGEGLANTRVIDALGGIAKIGAEGLVVISTPEGVTAAVKILDGSMRATTPVALSALMQVGAVEAKTGQNLVDEFSEVVRGGTAPLGRLRVTLG